VQAIAPAPDSTLRYTLDGSEPGPSSSLWTAPLVFNATQTLKVKAFATGLNPSATATGFYEKLEPRPPETNLVPAAGLRYEYYETQPLSAVPDFATLQLVRSGTVTAFDISPRLSDDHIAMRFTGFFTARQTGIYEFFTTSDDGSKLWIGNQLVVDNDGLHGAQERSGRIALAAGVHPITIGWFNALGQLSLAVAVREPGRSKQELQGLPLMVLGGEQACPTAPIGSSMPTTRVFGIHCPTSLLYHPLQPAPRTRFQWPPAAARMPSPCAFLVG
jgi:hypothetical protein